MTTDFIKFPSTPHLAVLGNTPVRDDKVLSVAEQNEFLERLIVVEEKIDGANLGVSFDEHGNIRLQNRGSYLTDQPAGQWSRLAGWIETRRDHLFDILGDRYILFGEWCAATHSVFYDRLPDWFLGFDVYDRDRCAFLSCHLRNQMLSNAAICPVPELAQGHFDSQSIAGLLRQSKVGSTVAEGIYLRHDAGDVTVARAKLVRAEFLQTMTEHWSRGPMRHNRLRPNRGCLNHTCDAMVINSGSK